MTPSAPRAVACPRVVAALLLTALGLLAPSRAIAGCGDYVVIGGRSADPHSPGSPGRSCHGPACTRPTPEPTPFGSGQVRSSTAPEELADPVPTTAVIGSRGSRFPLVPSLGTT